MSKYTPKVGVYAIMKDEITNVSGWVSSIYEADYVTVLDTGSGDGTPGELEAQLLTEQFDYHVHRAAIHPFRFDVAHNTALALMPHWVDICIPLAADERLSEGWYDALMAAIPANSWLRSKPEHRPGPYATKFTYEYEFAPGHRFNHDRIHSRFCYTWRYPFHEGVYPTSAGESRIHIPDFHIYQRQDKRVDRMKRDCELAELALREYPTDPRMAFYCGRQFMYAGQIDRALELLHRYYHLARAAKHEHPTEAAWCAEAIAQCYKRKAACNTAG